MEAALHLGFLAIIHDAQGYQGGLLITNSWSRPLEFRLTAPVQPTRVHQVLYGATLRTYVLADVIGKALMDKAATPVHLLVVDAFELLDLRRHLPVPVIWAKPMDQQAAAAGDDDLGWNWGGNALRASSAADRDAAAGLLGRLGDADLLEPFGRVREALAEARKRPAA